MIVGIVERNTPSVLLYDVNTTELDFVAKSITEEFHGLTARWISFKAFKEKRARCWLPQASGAGPLAVKFMWMV
jgi:hypothetical protein